MKKLNDTIIEVSLTALRDLQRDAERYRYLRDEENWGEDSGVDSWGFLGESTHGEFDHIVDSRIRHQKAQESSA